ncbi:MAG: asparagine synthase (glutamine-hydrolyzing) [Bacillota bacterium]
MCGLTGWIDWQQDLTRQQPILDAMIETLSPRGPDAAGRWLSTTAALGHRRLVVVDPAGGGQPMVRRRGDNTYVLVYNGELYNTPELRQELAVKGYTFEGHSDTEVLLLSFMEWGPACVDRFNGIYAFAVWDEAEQSLFMARDRMGVKPLFYAQRGSSLVFGSELKTLLAHPAVEPVLDTEGLAEIFVLGPGRTPGHGVFRGVAELRPGHCLVYNRQGLKVWPYWTLESKPHTDNLETTVATVRELVGDAIKRQLVADVPICTLLSGGLDSSAITAYAANSYVQEEKGPLHTFSVDYIDNDRHFRPSHFQPTSDAPWIKLVSESFNTVHHNVVIDTPQLIEALIPAVFARDLPGMADVDSSLLLFCREIKNHATVVLSGECADEIFGGYPWFRSEKALYYNNFPWSREVQTKMQVLSPGLVAHIKPEEYLVQRYRESLAEVPRLPGEDPLEARRREMFYLNFNWFMQTLLDRKDRMSMATGLEVRVPFCDHRIVEYVWNVPWEMKYCDGIEKGLLRRALSGVLPEAILTRRKSPYPKTHHPAYLAAVRDRVLEILDDSSSPLRPLINTTAIRAMARAEGDAFDRPWYGQLMTGPQLFAYLIQADAWLREYKVKIL